METYGARNIFKAQEKGLDDIAVDKREKLRKILRVATSRRIISEMRALSDKITNKDLRTVANRMMTA